jgi:4-hydroxy-tetrahydrodipicolinate synthase
MIPLHPSMLRGSIPPIVCPFRDGAIDEDAYAALVERQITGGSQGVLVNGTTGEPSTLTIEERKRLASIALSVAGGRIPVVVATGSQSHAETVELTMHADAAGADALLIVTPYYIKPPQEGLHRYFVDLAARTERPVLVYHIPGRAAVDLSIDTLCRIAGEAPNFVGMKHASTDLGLVTDAIAKLGEDFRIFVGLEELSLPMLAVGASGLMNAVANVWPEQVAALYVAVRDGRLDHAREVNTRLAELNRAVFFSTNPIPMKYMMRRLGMLEVNEHRLPMVAASPELEARLDDVLHRAGLLPVAGRSPDGSIPPPLPDDPERA